MGINLQNEVRVDKSLFSANEQSFLFGISNPNSQRMVDEPDRPQVLLESLDTSTEKIREVQNARRKLGEIRSLVAAFHYGIEDLREVALEIGDLNEEGCVVELPKLVGIADSEDSEVNSDPDELKKYRLTLEAQARFVLGRELSSSGVERE